MVLALAVPLALEVVKLYCYEGGVGASGRT